MRLNENEIRDITKFLENGKPLDDKYKYLLFKDNRQVELLWNGKNNNRTNVLLPFQTIEHIDEPKEEKIIQDIENEIYLDPKFKLDKLSSDHYARQF